MKAKKAKKALTVSMAAIAGVSVAQEQAAMQAAMHDMQKELGNDTIHAYNIEYTWNPWDGMLA